MNIIRNKKFGEGVEEKRNTAGKAYSGYTIAFLLISLVAFSQFIIFKKTMIWQDDGFLQWYAVLAKLKSVVTGLIQGKGIALWSWDTGLGADWIGNFALIFCDPFNYLVLFFPKEKLDVAYTLIVILKMYCAGAIMLAFLRYHGKDGRLCLIGAVGYAFSAWGIISVRHDFFMTQIVLFPLLILGVDKVEDKKSPLTLIFGVWLSVITSLYFSYMTAIFVCIYIVVKYFLSDRRKSVGDFLCRLFRYMLYAVVGGVLLAAPILVPSLYTLLHASTGSGVDIQILPTLKQLLRFVPAFSGTLDIAANNSVVGMNMLFVAMIPVMFLLWKKKKVSIWMFFISLVFSFFPILQTVMNGFSYASGRWCYILCFFFAYAAVECLESEVIHSAAFRKWVLVWFAAVFGISMIAFISIRAISVNEVVIILTNMIFGLAAYFVLIMPNEKFQKKLTNLFYVVCVNIALILVLFYSPFAGNMIDVYLTQGTSYKLYHSSGLKAAKKIKDSDFFRVDSAEAPVSNGTNTPFTHTPANINLYWGVPTLFEYLSTLDSNWLEFNKALGNNSGYFRRMCSWSNDNRSRMDYLLGVKYFLGDNEKKEYILSQYAGYGFRQKQTSDGVSVLRSKYDAGLGYVYQDAIPESDWKTYPALEREQVLMQCVQVQDEDIRKLQTTQTASAEEIRTETVALPYQLTGSERAVSSKNEITVTQEGASVEIELSEMAKKSEIYLVFHNLKKEAFTTEELWTQNIENGVSDNGENRLKYYADHLSETPYGKFAIMVHADDIRKRLVNAEGEPQAIRDVEDYTVNLGYKEAFSGKITCRFSNVGRYTYDSIEVIAVPQEDFNRQAEKLSENRLRVKEYNGNYVAGEIDTKEGGLLYLSILYNKGWKIFVDGKQVENDKIYQVNTAFTGIEVSDGHHEIVLRYRPVGHPFTVVLFVIGVLGTVAIGFFSRKTYRRENA